MNKKNFFNQLILIPYIILSLFSLVIVYSSSVYYPNPIIFLIKQALYVVLGFIVVYFVGRKLSYSKLRNGKILKNMMWFITILLAFARFFTGRAEGTGAHGWINLGIINIQPAELLKLGVILYYSQSMYKYIKKYGRINLQYFDAKNIVHIHLPVILSILLVLLMPDLGNALITIAIIISMFFISGIPVIWSSISILFLSMIYAFLPNILNFLNLSTDNYQIKRLISFIDPWNYMDTSGSQLINSYYAIARGGIFGVGPGNSTQKLGYLPESNTDFILAIVIEEFGAFGSGIVLILILVMIWGIFGVIVKSKNIYNRLMLFGIATFIFIQTFVNTGAVIGSLPITGVTFPFLSYGGSSFLIMSLSVALALRVERNELSNR